MENGLKYVFRFFLLVYNIKLKSGFRKVRLMFFDFNILCLCINFRIGEDCFIYVL